MKTKKNGVKTDTQRPRQAAKKEGGRPDAFDGRLRSRLSELRTLYESLYGADAKAWTFFTEVIRRGYGERNDSLRALDADRLRHPDWFAARKRLGMQFDVGAFAGSFAGVEKKLDYVAECGADLLVLQPFLAGTGGPSDSLATEAFDRAREGLGSMADLEALTAACHARGMAVCADFVLHHTGAEHAWAKAARAGDPLNRQRYFMFEDWDVPFRYAEAKEPALPAEAPGSFSWCEEADTVVMTTFRADEWDLNYADPVVCNDMTAALLSFINHGVDVVRLGGLPYLWKEMGTSCRDLPQAHTLLRLLRLVCETVCPGVLLMADAGAEPVAAAAYLGSGARPECHVLADPADSAALWHTVATHDVRLYRHRLEQVFGLPKDVLRLHALRERGELFWDLDYGYLGWFGMREAPHRRFLNDYLSGRGWKSDARGVAYPHGPHPEDAALCGTTASLCGVEAARYEKNEGKIARTLRLDVMLHALTLCEDGIPVLKAGDEILQENDYKSCDAAGGDARLLHCGAMRWDLAENRHAAQTPEGRMFAALRQLEELRAAHRVFDEKADRWLVQTGDDAVLGLGRYHQGEKLVALFNFSDSPRTVCVDELGDYTDLRTGMPQDKTAVFLLPHDFAWLLCDFDAPAKEAKTAREAGA